MADAEASKPKKSKKKKNNKTKAKQDASHTNGSTAPALSEENADLSDSFNNEAALEDADRPESSAQDETTVKNGQTIGNGATSTENQTSAASAISSTQIQSQELQEQSTEHLNVGAGGDLDKLGRERDELRAEVTRLRESLEKLQEKHETELSKARTQLTEVQDEKESAEDQYQDLLGKVNTIRTQLGDRLKADAEDLSQARGRLEEVEEENRQYQDQIAAQEAEKSILIEQKEQQDRELSVLRNRTALSQQNFSKEREAFEERETSLQHEFDAAKQAMQDWEILAMEERSIRESLGEKVTDLNEEVINLRQASERASSERDSQSNTVNGLQRALEELQEARRQELRETVENSQSQLRTLQSELDLKIKEAIEAKTSLESTRSELSRVLPYENEVKEKNLHIGKLRHEAVILNDHLTKALRALKKGKPESNIDKELVTNHFLHFLALDRGDPKKFQVLQIISNLLSWNEEQQEQAGLARPGASNPSIKSPVSPWHRNSSTAALHPGPPFDAVGRKESLGDLWTDFLDKEAGTPSKSPEPSTSQPPT